MGVERDWRSVFEETYAVPPSRGVERVWRRVFGDEYPNGVDPFSYISLSELERFASEVRVGPEARSPISAAVEGVPAFGWRWRAALD